MRVGQRAVELIERGARLERRHRVDEIARRLRPARDRSARSGTRGSVNSPGLGEPRARGHRRARRSPRSTTGLPCSADLDDVFAGVRMRRREERDERPVDRRAGGVAGRVASGCVARLERCIAAGQRPRDRADAAGPLMRTTPIPPRPGGVAIATMVSSVENIGTNGECECRNRRVGNRSMSMRRSSYRFDEMITVFRNASPMLSDVISGSSATARCTMRRA